MCHYRINYCSRIGSGKYKTYLTNNSVNHISSYLFKLVGPNRKSIDVTMLNKCLTILTSVRIIERQVCVYSVRSVFKNRVSKHSIRIVMFVIPH